MSRRDQLLERLGAIADSLAVSGYGRALLALGSVGLEFQRLDDYSDLDFFIIVERGFKQAFLEDLGWLERVYALGYTFRNTPDGYKAMFTDGVLCEFAIFEEHELEKAVYAPGRIIWQAKDFDTSLLKNSLPEESVSARTTEWMVGEAITNLYVGLCRYRRGEKLSAMRFVQGYALDRLIELTEKMDVPSQGFPDVFSRERRFEQRYPKFSLKLANFAQGYDRTPQSALAILQFLEEHFEVNPVIRREILALAVDQP